MPRTRVDWVDAAKGAAIILVVLIHSSQWTTLSGLAPRYWTTISLVLVLFLMPTFFLASALFAHTIVNRSWRELWRTRLSILVWALLVWTVVRYLYFLAVPNPTGIDGTALVDLVLAPVRPSNGLWFLYALALFFVAAKLMHGRVDWRIQLGVAAALSVWFFARADTGNIAWNGMGRYVFFFMVGYFFHGAITRFVERRGLPTGLLFAVLFLGFAAMVLGVRSRVPLITGSLVVASLLAIAAGLLIARYLTRFNGMRWLPYIGRTTLPVYVLHIFFVNLLTLALVPASGQGWLRALGPALPVLVAAVSVALALGVWRVTRDLPVLRYGYAVPTWFSGRPRPAVEPVGAGSAGSGAVGAESDRRGR
ncbi:acyltransferase family protein [Glaciibacter sp. 2TAF33]|uniref:acyltransferase family protein n=1 Tax=Glaciibacter sp. 2TAF33 TaxID=3233015 RepID=UPI003F90CFD1